MRAICNLVRRRSSSRARAVVVHVGQYDLVACSLALGDQLGEVGVGEHDALIGVSVAIVQQGGQDDGGAGGGGVEVIEHACHPGVDVGEVDVLDAVVCACVDEDEVGFVRGAEGGFGLDLVDDVTGPAFDLVVAHGAAVLGADHVDVVGDA